MTTDWSQGDLADFVEDFIVPQRDKPKVFNGDIPWCRIEDIDGVYLSHSKSGKGVTAEVVKEMPLRVFPKGTVLVSCSADLGRCAIAAKPLITNQTFIGLVPKATVDPQYLYYLMTSRAGELNNAATGATIKYLSQDKFRALKVAVPPLPEQQRIVTKLDAAFAALVEAQAHVERNRANARELFESYLNGVFEGRELDVELMRLGDVCKTGSGSTPLRSRKDYYDGGNVPWLLSGEVAQGEVTKATNFITELALKETSVKMFPPGTVLVAMYGGTAGEVGILRFASTTNQAVCGIHPSDHFIPEYLYFVFLQKKAELVAQAVGGAQPNISQEKIKNTVIPVPTIAQQRVIVDRLEAVRHQARQLESIYQQKLTELAGLKKAVLGAAFNGNL